VEKHREVMSKLRMLSISHQLVEKTLKDLGCTLKQKNIEW